jgi:hypothetical protein
VDEPPKTGNVLRSIPPLEPTEVAEALAHDSGQATREAQGFASGDLKEESAKNEHRRIESLKDHVHRMAVCGVWAVGALYFSGISIVIWHYVTPWPWLSPDQLHTVTAVVFSGAITSTGTKYFSKRVD